MMRMFKMGTTTSAKLLHFSIAPSHPTPVATPRVQLKKSALTSPLTAAPDSNYFSRLKIEEHNFFPRRKRMRSRYDNNCSAALSLPYSLEELETNQTNQKMLFKMSKQYVIEHANRRVDLFFYTLIAYYQTGFFPTEGHTDLQHGRGRNNHNGYNITEACHSCLNPSLLDKTIYQHHGKDKSLLSDTHLMDSLNSTVELPSFVNEFDDLLESACREKSLKILCDVSNGKTDPIEGLTLFLKMMNETLTKLKQQAQHQRDFSLLKHSALVKPLNGKLVDLVIQGSLATTFSTTTQMATDEYIQLLLRMTPKEKERMVRNDTDKAELYREKMASIQKEILESKHQHRHSTPGM